MATQAINESLHVHCPTVVGMVDTGAKKRAQQLLTAKFPDLAPVRNAAAHPAEIGATPNKIEQNSVSVSVLAPTFGGEDSTVFLQGMLIDGRYTFTLKERAVSYRPGPEAVADLAAVLDLWRQAFAPVEEGTFQLLGELAAKNQPQRPPG